MNLSILAAATPSLHRFLVELQTNRLGVSLNDTHYELSQGSRGYYGNKQPSSWKPSYISNGKGAVSSAQRSWSKENGHIARENVATQTESQHHFRPDLVGEREAHIEHVPAHRNEAGSRTSDGSDQMIIRQTVSWEVQYGEHEIHHDKDETSCSSR